MTGSKIVKDKYIKYISVDPFMNLIILTKYRGIVVICYEKLFNHSKDKTYIKFHVFWRFTYQISGDAIYLGAKLFIPVNLNALKLILFVFSFSKIYKKAFVSCNATIVIL